MTHLQFRSPSARYDQEDERQLRSAIEQNSRTVNAKLNQAAWLWNSYGSNNAPFINVKGQDYGAKGDGDADDYGAFLAAYNALPSTGGIILAPPGSYYLGTGLTVSKPVGIIGAGKVGGTKFIKSSALSGNLFTFAASGSFAMNLEVEGASGNGGDGIQIATRNGLLRDVYVHGMGGAGVRIGDDSGTNCNVWHLDNVSSNDNGTYGVYLYDSLNHSSPNANGGHATNLEVKGNTSHGVYLKAANINSFFGGLYEDNGGYGIYLDGDADYNKFFGGDNEANTSGTINIATGAVGNKFFAMLSSPISSISDSGTNTAFYGMQFDTSIGFNSYVQPKSFTPTMSFATPGDLSVSYTTQLGRCERIGNTVRMNINLVCTPTFSTASGGFHIDFSASGYTSQATSNNFHVGSCQFSGFTAFSTKPHVSPVVEAAISAILLFGSGVDVSSSAFTTSNLTSGTQITVWLTVEFEV